MLSPRWFRVHAGYLRHLLVLDMNQFGGKALQVQFHGYGRGIHEWEKHATTRRLFRQQLARLLVLIRGVQKPEDLESPGACSTVRPPDFAASFFICFPLDSAWKIEAVALAVSGSFVSPELCTAAWT